MAQRKDLEVGQERELYTANGRSSSRYANTSKARCRILALDQLVEVRIRTHDGFRYEVRENYVLVQVLAYHGWTYDDWSSTMERERPLAQVKDTSEQVGLSRRYSGQRRDPGRPSYGRSYTKFWSSKKLPEDQYLVATKLLGDIWNEDEKQAEALAKAAAKERQAKYETAVKAQQERLMGWLQNQGVDVKPPWRTNEPWSISSNKLAEIIEAASGGIFCIGQVYEEDFS